MPDRVDWLIERRAAGVVKEIAEAEGLAAAEAMARYFSSPLASAVADRETGLYLQGPATLYELMLHPELEP